ncbi:uncharacterized protein FMAN_14099 [Fusarium mangiferae]|uniref:Uncharacterized protein n=1 Tax=Fusarium mangiferae TaxID=192010 RepID=A0A1L7UMZ7_FUSMA|nr:uncharacterized protein FMAN_14099 [Fusarium mangiferae]CVL08861.1 uncharacterized protein FMAN_14099 [Fusarium mangiferae]
MYHDNKSRVTAWVLSLPDIYSYNPSQDLDIAASASPACKRKRKPVQVQELSPPPSVLSMDAEGPETPTKKRQRLHTDLDLTPRPQYETSDDPVKALSHASSSASGRTRSTSPLKRQFLELRLDESGLETKALNVDVLQALPNSEAVSLLRIMRRIGNCKGILPEDLRDQILHNHDIKQDDLDDWDLAFKDSNAFANLPGRIPSAQEIKLLYGSSTQELATEVDRL